MILPPVCAGTGRLGSAPRRARPVNPLLKFSAGRLATTRLAARQVTRRRRIMVIRATAAQQDRSSADGRACAGSGQPLPSPWIALRRVPVTAPGQTVRVCRIDSPTCLCNAARNAAMHALFELAVVRAGRNLARGAVTRQPPGCPGTAPRRRGRLPTTSGGSLPPAGPPIPICSSRSRPRAGRRSRRPRRGRSARCPGRPRVSRSRCGPGRSTASGAASPRRSATRRPRPARERRLRQRASRRALTAVGVRMET